jgi:hypothetical protein
MVPEQSLKYYRDIYNKKRFNMKIVITESQYRLLNEQPFFGAVEVLDVMNNVAGPSGDISFGTGIECQKPNPAETKVSQLFKFAQKQPQVQINQVGGWINRLKKGMEGLGANDDVLKVLKEIKSIQQLSTIINNWSKYSGNNQTLLQWLGEEHTITWDTIWQSFGKFKDQANIPNCLDKPDYLRA